MQFLEKVSLKRLTRLGKFALKRSKECEVKNSEEAEVFEAKPKNGGAEFLRSPEDFEQIFHSGEFSLLLSFGGSKRK